MLICFPLPLSTTLHDLSQVLRACLLFSGNLTLTPYTKKNLLLPVRRKNFPRFVITCQAVDAALHKNEPELGIFVLESPMNTEFMVQSIYIP